MHVASTQAPLRTPIAPRPQPLASGDSLLAAPSTAGEVLEIGFFWEGLPLDLRHMRPGDAPLYAGAGAADFVLPADEAPTGARPFCRREAGRYLLCFPGSWTVMLDVAGERLDRAALAASRRAAQVEPGLWEVSVQPGERLLLDTGTLSFAIGLTGSSPRLAQRLRDRVDWGLVGLFTAVSAGLGLLQAGLLTMPPSQTTVLAEADADLSAQLRRYQPIPTEIAKARPESGSAPASKREEGRAGERKARAQQAQGKPRPTDKEVASAAGILSAMDDNAETAALFGSSALSAEVAGGVGGLIGAKGTQVGVGGLGQRGPGIGGGGPAEGLGGLGGRGKDGRLGDGDGGVSLEPKKEGRISTASEPTVLGALDGSLIDAVIKRHYNQIRYCYQRGLSRDGDLGGKLALRFVIAKDGTVSKADVKSNSVGSEEVGACVAERVSMMKFPEPRGGGIVIVTYPFLFSAG